MRPRITDKLFAFALVLALCPAAVQAEVGVVHGTGTTIQFQGPYVLTIIEDGDPVTGIVWTRHSLATSRYVLNESGAANGDGNPAMVAHPSAGPIVVWGKSNGSGFDLVESRFVNGAWTPPAVIASAVTTSMDPEPAIALDKQTGAVHVVYATDDTIPRVMHTQAPADFSSWTPGVQVSGVGEDSLRPTVVLHQGTLTVAYESHGSGVGTTPRQIVVATSDGAGGFDRETIATTHEGQPNRPQLHTGTGANLWIDWVDDANQLAWTTWQPGNGWGSIQIEPFTDAEDRDYHVRGRVKQLAIP